jgi:2-phospho-L-lactate guanylyltransferase
MRSLPSAKSRLAAASSDPEAHRLLVQAIRHDTVTATLAASPVARVVAVADAELGLQIPTFIQSRPGLNPALQDAAGYAAREWPRDAIVALVGDLPALRPSELADALTEAEDHPRAFVADADAVGTTMLTALAGIALTPHFGEQSAARHSEDAFTLAAGPGLRLDVDTEADLSAALELGVGPSTLAVLLRQRPAATHR